MQDQLRLLEREISSIREQLSTVRADFRVLEDRLDKYGEEMRDHYELFSKWLSDIRSTQRWQSGIVVTFLVAQFTALVAVLLAVT